MRYNSQGRDCRIAVTYVKSEHRYHLPAFQNRRECSCCEPVKAGQQRLENKVRPLVEKGISRGDPETLSSQIDSVAGSISGAEGMLNDL